MEEYFYKTKNNYIANFLSLLAIFDVNMVKNTI